MGAYTRGPWTVGKRCGQEIRINAPNGDSTLGYKRWQQMATVYGCDEDPVAGGLVMEENARLIAAAPDLYEALTEMMEDIEARWDMNSPSTNPGIKHCVQQARAALAKADGRA